VNSCGSRSTATTATTSATIIAMEARRLFDRRHGRRRRRVSRPQPIASQPPAGPFCGLGFQIVKAVRGNETYWVAFPALGLGLSGTNAVQDHLQEQRQKMLSSSASCDLTAHLTTDPKDSERFERLGGQLKKIADDIGGKIAAIENRHAA
jgi:hypothetical protein